MPKSEAQIRQIIDSARQKFFKNSDESLPDEINSDLELKYVVNALIKDYTSFWRRPSRTFSTEVNDIARDVGEVHNTQDASINYVSLILSKLKEKIGQYSSENLNKNGQLYKSFKILQGKINTNAQLGAQDFKKVYDQIENFLRLFPRHPKQTKFEEMPAAASYGYGGGSAASAAVSGNRRYNPNNPFNFNGGSSSGENTTATNTANLGRGASSKGLNPFGEGEAASASKQQSASSPLGGVWKDRADTDDGYRGNYDIDELFKSDNRYS